jgi:hypothetical protein
MSLAGHQPPQSIDLIYMNRAGTRFNALSVLHQYKCVDYVLAWQAPEQAAQRT